MGIETKNGKLEEVKLQMEDLSDKEKDELIERLLKGKEEKGSTEIKPNPKLMQNPTAILKDIQKNHVKVEFDKELFGVKGRFVHLELPEVGNFKGFKFNCFISKGEPLKPGEFKANPNFENQSYSVEEIANLLKAINEYMKAYGVETDGDIDYINGLKNRDYENGKKKSKAGLDLANYIGLTDCIYRLKDYEEDKYGKKKYIGWNCYDKNNSCYFNKEDTPFGFFAHLMLKIQ